MRTSPSGELVAFIDTDRGELGGIATRSPDALFDRLDAVARLATDERFGGDADICAATRQNAFDRLVENLGRDHFGLGGLGPDLFFPLGVTVVIRLTLEDDVATGEKIGRRLAALPLDSRVLTAVCDRDLKRHVNIAKRYAGLAGLRVEEDAQQLDELIAGEVFEIVGLNGKHLPY